MQWHKVLIELYAVGVASTLSAIGAVLWPQLKTMSVPNSVLSQFEWLGDGSILSDGTYESAPLYKMTPSFRLLLQRALP
jgi:hypothetical protein